MLFRRPFWFRILRTPFRRKSPMACAYRGPIWGQASCGDLPLGRCAMAKNGCEIVAVYNALHFSGREAPLEHILGCYESSGFLMAWGHLGSDPYAAGDYLTARGIPHAAFPDFAAFEGALARGRAFILSYWLGDSLFSGVHGVALYRDGEGLWVCNLHDNQTEPRKVGHLSEILTPRRFIVGYEIY